MALQYETRRDVIESLTDKELIGELCRRGRLHLFEASGTYYSDMKDDDAYMRHCDDQIMRLLVRDLRNKLIPTIEDRQTTEHLAVRRAILAVLISREQAAQVKDETS